MTEPTKTSTETTDVPRRAKERAVFLAALMLLSLVVMTAAFVGGAV